MNSFQEAQRQIRIAIIVLAVVIPIGVLGFMFFERLPLLDALWLTVITLATVGYGDIFARTEHGRIFTIFMILFGLGAVAYGIQATAAFLVSPAIRDFRSRRRTQRFISQLQHHYLICGAGELVNKTITYLLDAARRRQAYQEEQLYKPVDNFLDRIFGDDAHGHFPQLRRVLRAIFLLFVRLLHRSQTLLDVIVVVTPSPEFAARLRDNGLLVVEGDPSGDATLQQAGIEHAQAMMVMLDNDTEALLTILTARSLNPHLEITAAALEEQLAPKMIRVGANGVIAPYEVAGQFLNNATLRPAVNEFFNSILFSQNDLQTTQIVLGDDSPWIGQRLSKLNLRDQYGAAVIGLRLENGNYFYAPGEDYILKEDEIIIVVLPARQVSPIQEAARGTAPHRPRAATWQRLSLPLVANPAPSKKYDLEEAEQAIAQMSGHFIVSGTSRVARNAINKLNPERPFVLISDNEDCTQDWLERGFRVIQGSPADEGVLRKAGIEGALAIMVALDDDGTSLLTVLNARAFSKRLLITATALNDEMIPKLQRAGADRVVGPFQVAAQFVLLATTRPAVSDFVQYVVFNYSAGIETTELYMQNDSPWIGKTIESLLLDRLFRAGVIGIRQKNGHYFYAPPGDYEIGEQEVLIVVTPMQHSDELRTTAHGSVTKRPVSLRTGYFEAEG
jgi:voltage-gated potassium channel